MKKGFVMYFENLRMIRDLPDHQYAAVIRVLGEYAERLSMGQEEEAYLEAEKKKLPRQVAMILEFMAGGARRDHEKYQEVEQRRSRYKEERKPRPAAPAPAVDDDIMKYIPD